MPALKLFHPFNPEIIWTIDSRQTGIYNFELKTYRKIFFFLIIYLYYNLRFAEHSLVNQLVFKILPFNNFILI